MREIDKFKNLKSVSGQLTKLESLREKDAKNYGKHLSLKDCILNAKQESGRGAFAIARDIRRWMKKKRITHEEYNDYELYRTDLTQEEKDRFIGKWLQWNAAFQCGDVTWMAVTEDKFLSHYVLENAGVSMPEILAVIDSSERDYMGKVVIKSAEDLKDFCQNSGNLPFFAKENRGICSFGAFAVNEANSDQLHIHKHGWVSYEKCFEELIGNNIYLIQKTVRNHSFFEPLTDGLATLRVYSCLLEDEVYQPFFILKIPSSENLSDNFWRPGNVACEVNGETGQIIRTVLQTGDGVMECDESTEVYQYFKGKSLPFWAEAIELSKKVARIYQPIKYQSVDIALTDDGPLLVEVNTGGAFELPQTVTRRGFLTDKVKKFFTAHGVDLA